MLSNVNVEFAKSLKWYWLEMFERVVELSW